MPSGRANKRARKKQRRAARVAAWTEAYRKRRRQRMFLLGGSLGVIAIGVLIVLFAKNPFAEKKKPAATAAAAAACPRSIPTTASRDHTKKYEEPGDAKLKPGTTYVWKLDTTCGDIDIELDTENDPKTTNSIAFLTKKRFFDGLFFHRISASVSVIQGGDPSGTGTQGAGYTVVEKPPKTTKYVRGVVAMAKSGAEPPGASSSQFFIVFGKGAEPLPQDYAVVGKVIKGMDVVDKISKTGKPDETPTFRTYIERATIVAE